MWCYHSIELEDLVFGPSSLYDLVEGVEGELNDSGRALERGDLEHQLDPVRIGLCADSLRKCRTGGQIFEKEVQNGFLFRLLGKKVRKSCWFVDRDLLLFVKAGGGIAAIVIFHVEGEDVINLAPADIGEFSVAALSFSRSFRLFGAIDLCAALSFDHFDLIAVDQCLFGFVQSVGIEVEDAPDFAPFDAVSAELLHASEDCVRIAIRWPAAIPDEAVGRDITLTWRVRGGRATGMPVVVSRTVRLLSRQ